MGKLQTAPPKSTFILGFLPLTFFPSDLLTLIAVGAHIRVDQRRAVSVK